MALRTALGSPHGDAVLSAEEPAAAPASATRVSLTALAMACGLVIVAYADGRARVGDLDAAYPLLWLGLLTIYLSGVWHAWRSPGRTEGLVVVVLLGLALYMAKVLDSPLHFTFHDEFSTLRVTTAAQQLGSPFHHDPLITIHPFFPGLELVTAAISSVTGVSIFISGLVLIGLMRAVMMAALYLIFEAAASRRIAVVATVLYAANPNFVFFNAQWAYESFSLPIALVAVALAARAPWSQWNARTRAALGRLSPRTLLVPLLIVVTVLFSHPMTSYALILFLLAWAVIDTRMARAQGLPRRHELWLLALSALGLTILWTVVAGQTAGAYFGPVLSSAASSAFNLLLGESAPKHLFAAPGVPGTPLAEQLLAFASVGLALAVIVLGLRAVRRQLTPLRATLALTAIVYLPSLPLRLTQGGTEISNRASEFVYIGIAFLAALVLSSSWRFWRPHGTVRERRLATAGVLTVAAVMFAGGIVIGWARYSRVPGPYRVVADERSVEPEGIAAARWANAHLGPHNRILVDRANGLLMGSIGEQDPQGGSFLGRSVPGVLLAPTFDGTVFYVLRKDEIDYVVADPRLSTGLPLVGVYVERDEPGAYEHTTPPTRAALLKYNGICPIDRVFDSGNIAIFDTRTLEGSYCPATTTGPHDYARFPIGPFRVHDSVNLSERAVVEQFDRLLQDPVSNPARLATLRQDLRLLRDRLTAVATSSRPASWNRFSRRWRWQELNNRLY